MQRAPVCSCTHWAGFGGIRISNSGMAGHGMGFQRERAAGERSKEKAQELRQGSNRLVCPSCVLRMTCAPEFDSPAHR